MALYYLQNSIRVTRNGLPTILRKGKKINSSQWDITALAAAGAQLAPLTNAEAIAQQALDEAEAKRGNVAVDVGLAAPGARPGFRYAGQISIADAATTGSVALTTNEPDTNYQVVLTPVSATAGSAAGSSTVVSTTKAVGSVAIAVEAAPTAGHTVVFDVLVLR